MTDTPHAEQAEQFVQVVDGIRTVMLTTVADDGELHARPMAVQDTTDDAVVWLLAESSSPKVDQIRARPQVGLAYDDDGAYVSATGRAEISMDAERKRELWSPFAEAWLQCEPEDDKAALIRIEVTGAELWEKPSRLAQVAGVAKALVLRTPPDVGESTTVTLR